MNFPAKISGKGFSCTFSIVSYPSHLFATSLGRSPFTTDIPIFSFEVDALTISREKYALLCKYLELKWDKSNPFRPVKFLCDINACAPVRFSGNAVSRSALVGLMMKSNEEAYADDGKKIYFCGWMTNPSWKSVSNENYNKTLQYFPEEEASARREKNQSSCWSANPKDENLNALNEFISSN